MRINKRQISLELPNESYQLHVTIAQFYCFYRKNLTLQRLLMICENNTVALLEQITIIISLESNTIVFISQ